MTKLYSRMIAAVKDPQLPNRNHVTPRFVLLQPTVYRKGRGSKGE